MPGTPYKTTDAAIVLLLVAINIAALQLLFVLLHIPAVNLHDRYLALWRWDSSWFENIAASGYHNAGPLAYPLDIDKNNVAFFPGYPLLIRLVHLLSGQPMRFSVLAAAQLAAAGFWLYFILLLRRWRIPLWGIAVAVFFVASYPGSFFMDAGYSESLLLMSFAGMLYWLDREEGKLRPISAFHGALLTLTHLRGVVLLALPFYYLLFGERLPGGGRECRQRIGMTALMLALCSLGMLAFFAYCYFAFRSWNLYFLTQQAGWMLRRPLRFVCFDRAIYHFAFPSFYATHPDRQFAMLALGGWLGTMLAVIVPLMGFVELASLGLGRGRDRRRTVIALGYVTGFFLIATLSSSAPLFAANPLQPMTRYGLPCVVLFAFWCTRLLKTGLEGPPKQRLAVYGLALLIFVASLFLFGIQSNTIRAYANYIFLA